MRIDLTKPVKGKLKVAHRFVIYGPGGVGKSSMAADAPSPIFFDPTGGTSELDVERVAEPEGGFKWQDLVDTVEWLRVNEHDYKTLVIDELGACEEMCWEYICKRDQKSSVIAWGYNKGFQVALDEWRKLVTKLDRLRIEKEVGIILIGHSQVSSFKNPEGHDYNRFVIKLHDKIRGLLFEWVDAQLFCKWESYTGSPKDSDKIIGVSKPGSRLMFTEERAAFDAKNRFSLPPKMSMNWSELTSAIDNAAPVDKGEALKELEALDLTPDFRKKVNVGIKKAGNDLTKLAKLLDWAKAKARTEGGEK